MPLIMNGTTIPTNVANALSFNGTNITQVVFNGTTVWSQSLGLSVGWSGSSVIVNSSWVFGLQTSGFNYRAAHYSNSWANSGAWQSVSTTGIFSGDSIMTDGAGGFSVSGNNIRTIAFGTYSSTWVTLATNGTFSGASTATHVSSSGYGQNTKFLSLNTSGGYVQFSSDVAGGTGAWVRMS